MKNLAGPGKSAASSRRSGFRAVVLWPLGILLVFGLALGVWLRPMALALYHLEVGGQALERAEEYHAVNPTAVNRFLDQALRHLEQAARLAPEDGYAHRRLGQAWLLAGKNDMAQQALRRAAELRPHNPLIQIELGYAWDGLGQAEQAVAAYERGRYGPAKANAIVNYLKLADWQIAVRGADRALEILKGKVLALEPNNLPALCRLVTIYGGMSQEGAAFALPIRERMQQFPADSVAVLPDPRLAEYLAEAMIQVTEEGMWTHEALLNVVAYQVWQFGEGVSGLGTERLLQALVEHWPEDADLLLYQGELYHRQGDLQRAETIYRQVLEMKPNAARVTLRLGVLAQASCQPGATQCSGWEEAAEWFAEYRRIAPGDLLGLKRLTEVAEVLGRPEAASLRQELEAQIDDRQVAARKMGVAVDQVELGPNLIQNGGFETWLAGGRPQGWYASNMSNYEPFGDAFYVSGADALLAWEGQTSARVAGLWQDRQPGQSRPRAGLWARNDEQATLLDIPIEAGQWYLISFMVQSADDLMSIWVSDEQSLLFANDRFLPSTQGEMRHFAAAFQSQHDGAIRPLIRYWGIGNVWFDDVAIRAVVIHES